MDYSPITQTFTDYCACPQCGVRPEDQRSVYRIDGNGLDVTRVLPCAGRDMDNMVYGGLDDFGDRLVDMVSDVTRQHREDDRSTETAATWTISVKVRMADQVPV